MFLPITHLYAFILVENIDFSKSIVIKMCISTSFYQGRLLWQCCYTPTGKTRVWWGYSGTVFIKDCGGTLQFCTYGKTLLSHFVWNHKTDNTDTPVFFFRYECNIFCQSEPNDLTSFSHHQWQRFQDSDLMLFKLWSFLWSFFCHHLLLCFALTHARFVFISAPVSMQIS